MSCHGTGAEQGKTGRRWEKVQCEACHGPGEVYIKLKSWWGVDPEGMRKLAVDAGFLIHAEEVCLRCHGQDRPAGHPQARAFNYKKAYERVAHKRGPVEYPIH
jgi:DnaJ-class molecular chaperone